MYSNIESLCPPPTRTVFFFFFFSPTFPAWYRVGFLFSFSFFFGFCHMRMILVFFAVIQVQSYCFYLFICNVMINISVIVGVSFRGSSLLHPQIQIFCSPLLWKLNFLFFVFFFFWVKILNFSRTSLWKTKKLIYKCEILVNTGGL